MILQSRASDHRHEDKGSVAAGVSFYPFAPGSKFGIPVGVGYQGDKAAGFVGYDLLMGAPMVGGGYINTKDDKPKIVVEAAAEK